MNLLNYSSNSFWNWKTRFIFILLGFLLLVDGIVSYYFFFVKPLSTEFMIQKDKRLYLRKFNGVLHLVQQRYVDNNPEKIGTGALIDRAIEGLVSSLDSYSFYTSPQKFKEFQEQIKGEYAGVGIIFSIAEGNLLVTDVIPNSPADLAGIITGDKIIKVNNKLTQGWNVEEVKSEIRGPVGSSVKLTVLSPSGEIRDCTLVRKNIKVPSIRHVHLLSSEILYFQISQFTATTFDEILEILGTFAPKIAGIIIDLRYNPGGLLDSAHRVSSIFLPTVDDQGERLVVASTLSRLSQKREILYVLETPFKVILPPMVLLVNEHSASAAEVFSGCLKDHKRAILVGTKTFGKAAVQQEIPLIDESAIRLTVAYYYTPSNHLIQNTGIFPDVLCEIPEVTKVKILQQLRRFSPGNNPSAFDDPQLLKAIELVQTEIQKWRERLEKRLWGK